MFHCKPHRVIIKMTLINKQINCCPIVGLVTQCRISFSSFRKDSQMEISEDQLSKSSLASGKLSSPLMNGHRSPAIKRTYRETIGKLMTYENNFSVLKKINPRNHEESRKKLELIAKLLDMINIKPKDLNRLNVIHMAGTKGKGSTCAYIESILRERGYKTGLFTSPHLVSVRERIRLAGRPISTESFIKYLWEVDDVISRHPEKPGYFMYLTILGFHIFLQEKVDVLILECGVGGEFDCTNIIPKPIAAGITSLGIDHTSILGDTLASIAWHKAGILKPGSIGFTVPQEDEAMKVIKDRSAEKKCQLVTSPPLESYQVPSDFQLKLGIEGRAQQVNASLALQISRHFHDVMKAKDPNTDSIKPLSANLMLDHQEINGLKETRWPGRCQVLKRGRITYFLDGAHTVESLENCLDWFNNRSPLTPTKGEIFRVLLFFSAGHRPYEPLIQRVAQEDFDQALFSSNYVDHPEKYPEMIVDPRCNSDGITERITKTREIWLNIQAQRGRPTGNCLQFVSLSQALQFLESESFPACNSHLSNKASEIHVLVTGSLLFVGNLLTLIDPELKELTGYSG